jgi:hypothetical protein
MVAQASKDDRDDEPVPDGVSPALWAMILSIKEDTKSTRAQAEQLEGKVSLLESQGEEMITTVTNLQSELAAMKKTIATLSGRIIRNEATSTRNGRELTDLKVHSMKTNIIINFDRSSSCFKEKSNENYIAVARLFFSDVMGISTAAKLSIPTAHRLGPNSGMSRPMIVKLPIAAEFSLVMSKVKSLSGTHHFITQQLPPTTRERKQFTLPMFKAVRQDKTRQARIVQDRLYVDGTLQCQFLPGVLPDVITVSSPGDDDTAISRSATTSDSGSTFTGFASPVHSLMDVRHVLDTLLQQPQVAAATHLIYAYRIDNAGIIENFDSDTDFGVGLELLKSMTDGNLMNTLFVATRTCGPNFVHIGKRRFDHVRTLCMEAHNKDN